MTIETATLKAIHKFCDGEQYGVSTSIADTTTYGYGNLDDNGFWEFPLPAKLAELNRRIKQSDELLVECHKTIQKFFRELALTYENTKLNKSDDAVEVVEEIGRMCKPLEDLCKELRKPIVNGDK